MPHPFYSIQVRPIFTEAGQVTYKLHNFDAPAGDRLRKRDTPDLPWPFGKKANWTEYEDEAQAEKAAARLQKYLDTYESKRSNEESNK